MAGAGDCIGTLTGMDSLIVVVGSTGVRALELLVTLVFVPGFDLMHSDSVDLNPVAFSAPAAVETPTPSPPSKLGEVVISSDSLKNASSLVDV